MHKLKLCPSSELWCLVTNLCPTLQNPMACNHQAPLSMGCPRQEYWGGLSFPSLDDLPDPGIKPSYALADGFFTTEPPGKPQLLNKSVCSKLSLNLLCFVMVMLWFHFQLISHLCCIS